MKSQILGYIPKPIKRILRRLRNAPRRRSIAMGYYNRHLRQIRSWVWKDTETSNFYYNLTPINLSYLAHLVSSVTGESYDAVMQYFDELDRDEELRAHFSRALKNADYGTDIQIEYGRRLGWYAFARSMKPKVIVETGVDHGVGSCVLASAILRNRAEGFEGYYYGTEIRPEAGQLFAGRYADAGKILYGDSIESLSGFSEKIDLFINDSDHSADYEYREYQVIADKLSDHAAILGDNSHVTEKLAQFSRETGRKFIFFSEKPHQHWYPGAGIGVSFT